jgi:CHASE3 domain sensor protein
VLSKKLDEIKTEISLKRRENEEIQRQLQILGHDLDDQIRNSLSQALKTMS